MCGWVCMCVHANSDDKLRHASISSASVFSTPASCSKTSHSLCLWLAQPAVITAVAAAASGLLLFGPPGCGKTHVVAAAVAATDARLISVKVWDDECHKRVVCPRCLCCRQAPCSYAAPVCGVDSWSTVLVWCIHPLHPLTRFYSLTANLTPLLYPPPRQRALSC